MSISERYHPQTPARRRQEPPAARAGQSPERFTLLVGADTSSVAVARRFAASLAAGFACPPDRVDDLRIAISEACTNAVQAHRRNGADEPIRIDVERAGHRLTFAISDRGGGFDATAVGRSPQIEDGVMPKVGGLGLYLIESLFPSARIERNDRGGMTIRFALDLPLPEN